MDMKMDMKVNIRTPDHPEWIPGIPNLAHATPPNPNSSTPGRNKTIQSILPTVQMLPTKPRISWPSFPPCPEGQQPPAPSLSSLSAPEAAARAAQGWAAPRDPPALPQELLPTTALGGVPGAPLSSNVRVL